MKRLKEEVVHFFRNQGCVIVSTIDPDGNLHSSCKGVIKISENGRVYLLDLYQGRTYENLTATSRMSITAIDEHRFKGYCLKGKGAIIRFDQMRPQLVKMWDDKITSRITQRILKNLKGEKGHPRHPEVFLPKPKYLIVMEVAECLDLTPHHMREVQGS